MQLLLNFIIREEKNRRIEQQKNAEKLAIEMANKVSAMTFSQAYLGSLLTNTYQKLLERGYLYDYDEHGKLIALKLFYVMNTRWYFINYSY